VGVSHYQDALRGISGSAEGEPVRHSARAALVPEPANPHDPNAVMVLIEDRHVGYLSREDAVRYGPAVKVLREHGRLLVCDAVIGGRGPASDTPNLGVFLELPRAPEAVLEARTMVRG
jgi:hypothetical protein